MCCTLTFVCFHDISTAVVAQWVRALSSQADRQMFDSCTAKCSAIGVSVTGPLICKEPSLLNGHECRA